MKLNKELELEYLTLTFHTLASFWLREVEVDDISQLREMPVLGQSVSGSRPGVLTELAVEYQRLFGFNLPLYESVYVDPSGMLNTEATQRVRRLYARQNWQPESDLRTAADDHLGVELQAISAWTLAMLEKPSLKSKNQQAINRLWGQHLALWAPVCIQALQRLDPHPFYAALGELTVSLLLFELPESAIWQGGDPFPELPPAPDYRASQEPVEPYDEDAAPSEAPIGTSLRKLTRRLMTPSELGMYLTRTDILKLGRQLELPVGVGERSSMLRSLFELAGQYEMVADLALALSALLKQEQDQLLALEDEFPQWEPYGRAWRQRLAQSVDFFQQALEDNPLSD